LSPFKANCTKFDFRFGCTPDTADRWKSLHCSTDPLAVFKGPVSKAREGKWEKMGIGQGGREERREGP